MNIQIPVQTTNLLDIKNDSKFSISVYKFKYPTTVIFKPGPGFKKLKTPSFSNQSISLNSHFFILFLLKNVLFSNYIFYVLIFKFHFMFSISYSS